MVIDFDGPAGLVSEPAFVVDFDTGTLGGEGTPPIDNPPLSVQPRRGRMMRRRKFLSG